MVSPLDALRVGSYNDLVLVTSADPRRETACLACRAVILGRALTASYAVLDISSKNGRAFLEYERTAGARAVLRHCCLFRACIMSKSRVTYTVACEACWEYINLVSNILRMNTLASAAAFSGTAFSEEALASASAFALASAAALASAPAFEMPPQVSHIKSSILQCVCMYAHTCKQYIRTKHVCT